MSAWNDITLLQDALELWGSEAQIDMAQEEIGELLTKIGHFKRGRCDKWAVAEEIADVMLMMEQISYLFDRKYVECWLELKSTRLRERIEEAKANVT
jgi:NTP pyrophosphatase (non-canonical NTP hydrolase)